MLLGLYDIKCWNFIIFKENTIIVVDTDVKPRLILPEVAVSLNPEYFVAK